MENNIVTFLHIFFVFLVEISYTEKWNKRQVLLVYFMISHMYFQYKHGSMI